MKKKFTIAAIAALLLAIPAMAVFNERDLGQTISVLRFELKQQYDKLNSKEDRMNSRNSSQRRQMIQMMKKCNELSLILYSQNQDFTFDMTYALGEVTKQYEDFSRAKMPFDDIVATCDIEIDRYERLLESLRRLPPAIMEEDEDVPDSLVHRDIHAGHDHSAATLAPMAPRAPRVQMDSAQRAKRRAFVLDEQGQEDRDSCIFYAKAILRLYKAQREKTIMDSEHYEDMSDRLKVSYDYAQNKYRMIQERIFINGQDDYFTVLKDFPKYTSLAIQEARQKYASTSQEDKSFLHSLHHSEEDHHKRGVSEWRGPVVAGFIFFILFYLLLATVVSNVIVVALTKSVAALRRPEFQQRKSIVTLLAGTVIFAVSVWIATKFMHQNFIIEASDLLMVFAWLLIAILVSLLVRLRPEALRNSVKLYAPVVVLGLIVICFRIVFIPNRLLNLVYPPLLLIFAVWQLAACIRRSSDVQQSDLVYGWVTFVVVLAATVASWMGYVLFAVQVFIWWLFQLVAIESITAVYDLLVMYEKKHLVAKLDGYDSHDGENIGKTWAFDLLKMALIPVTAILSVLVCIWLAAGIFDLQQVCKTIFFSPFFDLSDTSGNPILHLSLFKLVLVSALFFVFRYLSYLLKAFYKKYMIARVHAQDGVRVIRDNEINLTLPNNLIAISVWGIYIIMAIVVLKIPMGALSVVAAGLATGIGLALKDVLNNFIYGIQLMSGRLRVGDYIECDGVRGKVDGISYQTTQIITADGAVMSFTNSTLFNNNFKNLSKNNSYELVAIPVGVAYGTDVKKVREVLVDRLKDLCVKDAYGRDVVDSTRGITVAFSDFGDSSVDLVVKQYVLVEEKIAYQAAARELIYNTLNENSIEIPFPQRDLHIRDIVERS